VTGPTRRFGDNIHSVVARDEPEKEDAGVEREILRDDRLTVTSARIVLATGREYALTELTGAQLVHDGRNHFVPLFVGLALLGVGLGSLESSTRGPWSWLAALALALYAVRYLVIRPKLVVRVFMTGGGRLDIASSTNIGQATDIARAVEDAIASASPEGYEGRRSIAPYTSSGARFGEAIGVTLGLVVGALAVGKVISLVGHGGLAALNPQQASGPPVWTELNLDEIVVEVPGPPTVTTRTELQGGLRVTLQEHHVGRGGGEDYCGLVGSVADVAGWDPEKSVDGAVNGGLEKARSMWFAQRLTVRSDEKKWFGDMAMREVVATADVVGGSKVTLRIAAYSRWAKFYGIIATTQGEPRQLEIADRVFASVRAPGGLPMPAPATSGHGAGVQTWRCADSTFAYGFTGAVCQPRGGVFPSPSSPSK
jgi:hypothetical protein